MSKTRLLQRAAKSIAKLVGSVTAIVGGKETAVDVKDVAKSAGKTLDDPVLKKAGITIKILDRKKASGEDGADKNIAYTIEGDTGMLLKVELIDSKGAPVPSQSGRSKVNDEPWIDEIMAENNGKLPDGAGLKVTVLAGAKTVKVPIELKDIPLP